MRTNEMDQDPERSEVESRQEVAQQAAAGEVEEGGFNMRDVLVCRETRREGGEGGMFGFQ